MPLINWKVELKLNWQSIFTAGGADNDVNFNNIVFTIKDTKLFVPAGIL